MKSLSPLYPLSLLLALFALAQYAHADELPRTPLRCDGFPDQPFNGRLGNEMQALIQSVRCQDLRAALRETQLMEREIVAEIQKGNSAYEYGECYFDRKCTEQIGRAHV